MRSLLLISVFQCCLVQALFSQDFAYSMKNYAAAEGLPQSQITDIVEDENGYLWMGTQGGGMTRFDGREFKVYTVKDNLLANEISDLHFDSKKKLWALHHHGVSSFDGFKFKTYQIPDSLKSRFWRIYNSNDTIFLLSTNGLQSKIYNDSIIYWEKPFFKNYRVRFMHIAPTGEQIFMLGNGKFVIKKENQIDSIVANTEIGRIYNLFNWKHTVLAQSETGLFKLYFNENRFIKLPWTTRGSVLAYDQTKNIFWTTDENNLFKESYVDDKLIKFDTILADVAVKKIISDSEGNTWLGTDGNGLYRYYAMDFYKVTPDKIKGVMAVLVDREDNIWIGTMSKGLWKIKNGKISSYYNRNEPARNTIYNIKQAADGTIWVGTRFGLGQYDKKLDSFNWHTSKDGLPGSAIISVDIDDHGVLWAGTNRGVAYLENNTFKIMDEKNGLRNVGCWSIYYSKFYNTCFVGTDDGLFSIYKKSAKIVPLLNIKNAFITSIHAYRDSLLVLSTGGSGTIILNPKSNQYSFVTTHEGLASDFNYFATEDEANDLWIGSEKGINKLKLNNNSEVVQNLYYGSDNGLKGVETNQNAFAFNGSHKFFGLVDGLYCFYEQSLIDSKSFDLHLRDVEILYGEYSARDYTDSLYTSFKIPFNPILPPDKNHITFHFNRVDKRHPNSVKYKYILENFDKAWSLPSSMQQVTYGNLPPGEYVFRVKATNSTGNWSGQEIAYPFIVLAPFYMRASSIIGLVILLIGITTLSLYIRVKQRIRKAIELERIRAQQQEMLRKEIARDFHDEMGNQLTRIINYVSLLKLNNNGNGSGSIKHNHTELYGKVEESAKYLYTGTRDFIWAIDPVNDELSKLFIHIRDFGEKLFEEKNISFRAFNNLKECIKLPYGFSREANFIFKEAMTNAFKYSQAKNVTFSLYHHDDCYEIILEDDGIGFYVGEIEKTNGLKNIRERADRINSILRISSNKNQGTTIILNFKLSKNLNYGYAL